MPKLITFMLSTKTAGTMMQTRRGRRATLSCARTVQQRRPFFGLQRTPAPPPRMMGYLVAQGLAIVLLGDLTIATLRGQSTVVRSVCQAAGLWNDSPRFDKQHEETSAGK